MGEVEGLRSINRYKAMSVAIVLVASTLAGFVFSDVLNVSGIHLNPEGEVALESLDVPDEVVVGQSIHISFSASHNWNDGDIGWLTVSFPDAFSVSQVDEASLDSTFQNEGIWGPDHLDLSRRKLTGCYEGCRKAAIYPMAEAYGDWPKDDARHFELDVVPKHIGEFRIYFRANVKDSSCSRDSYLCLRHWPREPAGYGPSGDVQVDQHEEYVFQKLVVVEPDAPVAFLPLEVTEVEYESVVEKSGEYFISLRILNPNTDEDVTLTLEDSPYTANHVDQTSEEGVNPKTTELTKTIVIPKAGEVRITFGPFTDTWEWIEGTPWWEIALNFGIDVGAAFAGYAAKHPIKFKRTVFDVHRLKELPRVMEPGWKTLQKMADFTRVVKEYADMFILSDKLLDVERDNMRNFLEWALNEGDIEEGLLIFLLAFLGLSKRIQDELVHVHHFTAWVEKPGFPVQENLLIGLPATLEVSLLVQPEKIMGVVQGLMVVEVSKIITQLLFLVAALSFWGAIGLAVFEAGLYVVAETIINYVKDDPPGPETYRQVPDPLDYAPDIPEACMPRRIDSIADTMADVVDLTSELIQYVKATQIAYGNYLNAKDVSDIDAMSDQIEAMNEFGTVADGLIFDIDKKLEILKADLETRSVVISPADIQDAKDVVDQWVNSPPGPVDFREYRYCEEYILTQYGIPPQELWSLFVNTKEDWLYDYGILGDFGYVAPIVPVVIRGQPSGIDIPDIPEPNIDGCGPFYGEEGEAIGFDAGCVDLASPTARLLSQEWDFNGDGVSDSFGKQVTYTWFDNVRQLITLSIAVADTIMVDDGTGNKTSMTVVMTYDYQFVVTVYNRDPQIEDTFNRSRCPSSRIGGFLNLDFTLRVAGEKWHDVKAYLLADNESISTVYVYRTPGSPDDQSSTDSGVCIDIEKVHTIRVEFDPYDDPINGQVQGSSPTWVFFTFKDGVEMLHHNFNVEQSTFRDTDRWIHVEPWIVDLSPIFIGHEWTFLQTTTDPGTDDLCLKWDWGDGTETRKVYTWPPGGTTCGDDGGSTPYDRWMRVDSYPPTTEENFYHTYMFEGNFVVRLSARDDESGPPPDWEVTGTDSDSLVVRSIHWPHIAPVK